ncbi:hypothetical protein MD484_g6391, partial [Candolleomyces efflorescens]
MSDPAPVEDEEFYSSWSLFLVCTLLILSLWTSYYLQIKRIRAIHETLVSVFAGMFVGLVVRLAPGTMIREMLTFKHTLFFNLLLPPIILNSGYELKQENFFRNFASIIVFAFVGTFISAVGVGVLVHIYSFLGIEGMDLSLVECLTFGSTLSATDPVTILAIFNQYKVDPKLYTVIFGESLLNDAVSIVMYETLSKFHGEEVYLGSIFHGVGIFLISFLLSTLLGITFGLLMSLLLKHSHLHHFPHIESCLVALCAYTCYFLSTGLTLSGIVSLLFCGITLKHYAFHTMSRKTQRASKSLFSVLAQLSENFIFIYLGMALFTSAPTSEPVFSYVKPLFILITTIAVVFTRYAAVFPLAEVINFFHRQVGGQRHDELPHSYQMMLFWAGLRGAVGVALAAGFNGPNAKVLRMTVLLVVVITVLFFGGTTARMLEVMKIRTGVPDEDGGSDSEDEDGAFYDYYAPLARNSNGFGGPSRSRRWSRDYQEGAARVGAHYGNRGYNHHVLSQGEYRDRGSVPPSPGAQGGGPAIFSSASSESYDSDGGEVLPLAPTAQHQHQQQNDPSGANVSRTGSMSSFANLFRQGGGANASVEDGKWFQAIDERYLLPLFSNATASRTFNARRTARRAAAAAANAQAGGSSNAGNGGGIDSRSRGDPDDEDAEGDLSLGLNVAGVTGGSRVTEQAIFDLGRILLWSIIPLAFLVLNEFRWVFTPQGDRPLHERTHPISGAGLLDFNDLESTLVSPPGDFERSPRVLGWKQPAGRVDASTQTDITTNDDVATTTMINSFETQLALVKSELQRERERGGHELVAARAEAQSAKDLLISSLAEARQEGQTLVLKAQERQIRDEETIVGLKLRLERMEAEALSAESSNRLLMNLNTQLEAAMAWRDDRIHRLSRDWEVLREQVTRGQETIHRKTLDVEQKMREANEWKELFYNSGSMAQHRRGRNSSMPSIVDMLAEKDETIGKLADRLSECHSLLSACRSHHGSLTEAPLMVPFSDKETVLEHEARPFTYP